MYLGVGGRLAVVVGAVGPDDGQLAATIAARPRNGSNLEDFYSSLFGNFFVPNFFSYVFNE